MLGELPLHMSMEHVCVAGVLLAILGFLLCSRQRTVVPFTSDRSPQSRAECAYGRAFGSYGKRQ